MLSDTIPFVSVWNTTFGYVSPGARLVPESHTIHASGVALYTNINVESAPIPCGIHSPSAEIPKMRAPLESSMTVVWLRHDSSLSSCCNSTTLCIEWESTRKDTQSAS